MAADGNVRAKAGQVRFGQARKNLDLLVEMKRHIGHAGEPSHIAATDSFMLSWTNRVHVEQLALFNVVDAKSLTFRLPSHAALSWDFLRGYVDGDGCVGRYDNGAGREYLHISWVGTPQFIEQCDAWLPVRGLRRSLRGVDELRFNGRKAVELASMVYPSSLRFKSRKHLISESAS